MERKKRNEQFQKQRQDLKAGVKTKTKPNPKKDTKPEKKEDKGFIDGQIGKYRNGVQYLSQDDIKKVLGSR
nr:hypothetical protein BaRGS_014080 [Batillaria attramentaria]